MPFCLMNGNPNTKRQIRKNRYAAPLLKKEDWTVSIQGMAFFKKACEIRVEDAGSMHS